MPSPAKTGRKTAQERKTPSAKSEEKTGGDSGHLRMHTVRLGLPIPYFTPEDLRANTRTVTSWRPQLPPTRDLVFYGGLGTLAVAGALEWPVALAVGGAALVIRGRGPAQEHPVATERRRPSEPADPRGTATRNA